MTKQEVSQECQKQHWNLRKEGKMWMIYNSKKNHAKGNLVASGPTPYEALKQTFTGKPVKHMGNEWYGDVVLTSKK